MNSNISNNTLTITLPEKIDSHTAPYTQKDMMEIVNSAKAENIVLDAKDTTYISSAGLRIILNLKKEKKAVSIINVSSNVYEVFEMTGFSDIIDIEKAMREISIDGCEMIGKGGHGEVYRLDADTIIKVYDKLEPLSDIKREIEYARNAFVSGIPTAIAYDVVKCDDRYGTVFELINADTLGHKLTSEPEKYDEFSKKYIDLVHILHTTELDTNKFSSIKSLYNSLINDMKIFYTDEEIDILHRLVDSIPDRKTVVHGDIHPKNVMIQNDELVIIDMADLTYGHPIFDFMGMGLTHFYSANSTPEMTIGIIGVDAKTAISLWKDVISHEFNIKTNDEFEKINKLLLGYTMLKLALTPAISKTQNPKMTEQIIINVRKRFFPIAENLIGKITF